MHGVHLEEPSSGATVPAGQSWHAVHEEEPAAKAYVPRGHVRQVAELARVESHPAGHGSQLATEAGRCVVLSALASAGGVEAGSSTVRVPAGQRTTQSARLPGAM